MANKKRNRNKNKKIKQKQQKQKQDAILKEQIQQKKDEEKINEKIEWSRNPDDRNPNDWKWWSIIYPIYLQKNRKKSDGRRIAMEKCCVLPTCTEISKIASHFGLHYHIESNKGYSRDGLLKGRVRVRLKDVDGKMVHENFKTRNSFLETCGEMIPRLKSRTESSSSSKGKKTNKTSKKSKKKGRRR